MTGDRRGWTVYCARTSRTSSAPCRAAPAPFDAGRSPPPLPAAACRCWRATTWRAARAWSRDPWPAASRPCGATASCCRCSPAKTPVTLGEGFTPLVHAARLGAALGLDRLYVKDESLNPDQLVQGARPVGRRDARQGPRRDDAVAADGRQRRQRHAAAYAAAAGHPLPRSSCRATSSAPSSDECELYGADVTLVDGLITDAGRIAGRDAARALGWYDVSTLQGAVPHRRQEDDGLRAGRAVRAGELPDWIIYPTGGGTGMVGMWKAFDEMEALGWIAARPAAADGDGAGRRAARRSSAPSRRAPSRRRAVAERRTPWPTACACRRPSATSCVLRAVRESGGTALVGRPTPRWSPTCSRIGRLEGISAAPEGAAALVGRARCSSPAAASSRTRPSCSFNTGGALKYLDVLRVTRCSSKSTSRERNTL